MENKEKWPKFFITKRKEGLFMKGKPEEINRVLKKLIEKYGPKATIKEVIEKEFGISYEDIEKKKN